MNPIDDKIQWRQRVSGSVMKNILPEYLSSKIQATIQVYTLQEVTVTGKAQLCSTGLVIASDSHLEPTESLQIQRCAQPFIHAIP